MCGSAGNNKVVRCNSVVVVIHKVIGGLLRVFVSVDGFVGRVWSVGNE